MDYLEIDVSFESSDSEALVELEQIKETSVTMDSAVHAVATDKHDELLNRDLPNQHTIESITGLSEELSDLKEIIEDLSLKPSVQSYNDLTDKPLINNVELIGNKTYTELGIAPIDDIEIEAILTVD